ncbi:MAG: FAD/NAD(P)-binding oxidoreductase [Pseudomonadota bacterium]
MTETNYDVVIVGGRAGGIATASSLRKRDKHLSVAIVEPSRTHRYQPGQTLVGGGVFKPEQLTRPMQSLIPKGVEWIQERVRSFEPDEDRVTLSNGDRLCYSALVAAPGIELHWDGIEGARAALGRNGVTSNYEADLAPSNWKLVQELKGGKAVFSQPPMPIKCAGAPQKALYLSCSEWERSGRLKDIDVHFHNAGGVLFGVADYVPALEGYMNRYGVHCHYGSTLTAVDGGAKQAVFSSEAGEQVIDFDFLHLSPPQRAPAFIRDSALADTAGYLDLAPDTLQHVRYPTVFGLGDASGTGNAKTAAAIRKQAPVVATNLLAQLRGEALRAAYSGYGSCPLTVERGKVVLAEFAYGGKLQPTVPKWINDGTRPTTFGWLLKSSWLPPIYFDLMLKGREWLAAPKVIPETAGKPAIEGHGG